MHTYRLKIIDLHQSRQRLLAMSLTDFFDHGAEFDGRRISHFSTM